MNNNWFKNLFDKVFRSGDPVYLYIGINVLVFIIVAIADAGIYLSGNTTGSIITRFAGLPADLSLLPERFYSLITYQFLNAGLINLLFNMITLYWTGIIFMDFLKPRQFHFVYLTGGLLGGLFYIAAFNLFPAFQQNTSGGVLLGAPVAVMAVAAGAATLVPDYTLKLMFIGFVKLKYIVMVFLLLDILFMSSTNPGGSFAIFGSALGGFIYIKLVRGGFDLSSFLKRKSKLKVVKNNNFSPKRTDIVNQQEIDAILDKISSSGYDKLTAEEKAKLFKASEK